MFDLAASRTVRGCLHPGHDRTDARASHRRRLAYVDGLIHADAIAHGGSQPSADQHRCSDGQADAAAHCDACANTTANSDPDAGPNTRPDTYPNAHNDAGPDTYPNASAADLHAAAADANADTNCYACRHFHANSTWTEVYAG